MRFVIDVDDELYERLKNNVTMISGLRSGKTIMSDIYMAVANGVPLHKGHGDLIDVGAIDTRYSDPEVIETLNAAPVIIEADAPNRRKGTPREDYEPLYDCEDWIP